ncbi:unnamed protein product, partial [Musa banksii]
GDSPELGGESPQSELATPPASCCRRRRLPGWEELRRSSGEIETALLLRAQAETRGAADAVSFGW